MSHCPDRLPACPVEVTLKMIGDKWKVLILRELMEGARRTGVLRKSIQGISQKMLSQQLKAMADDGLVTREAFAEIPPRVEYSLTDRGRSLSPVLGAMEAWGSAYKHDLATERTLSTLPAVSKNTNVHDD